MALKLSQKTLLLIAIPLGFELAFLGALMFSLEQSEKDARAIANAGMALVYVNVVLYDAVDAVESLIVNKSISGDQLSEQLRTAMASLEEHRNQLRTFADENPSESADLKAFNDLVGGFSETFLEASDVYSSGGYISNVRATGKLRSYVTRIKNAGNEIIDHHVKERQRLSQKRSADVQQLKVLLVVFSLLVVAVPLWLAMMLGSAFRSRLKRLVTNTQLIAMNKPLPPALSGSDELAVLDQVVHRLATELETSRRQERAMLDNTGEIILSLDANLKITQVNPAVQKILGREAEDMLGAAIQSFVHEEDQQHTFMELTNCREDLQNLTAESSNLAATKFNSSMPAAPKSDTSLSESSISGASNSAKSIADTSNRNFESRLRRVDGRYIYALWNVNWSNENKSFFCVIHDFSENKEAELLREEVLTMVSHDLRSPLSNVRISLELLADDAFGTLSPEASRTVKNAETSVVSLISMINELLEVKRTKFSHSLDLAEVNVNDLIQQAIDMLAAEAKAKLVSILFDKGHAKVANLDCERIRRVLVNLLGNAIKFSPHNAAIKISATELVQNGFSSLQITVKDQGPGVPQDKLQIIFEKFGQAGTGTEAEKSGSGLGLAICKAIIESHGGTIGVENSADGGSEFWFRVPSMLRS